MANHSEHGNQRGFTLPSLIWTVIRRVMRPLAHICPSTIHFRGGLQEKGAVRKAAGGGVGIEHNLVNNFA